MKSMVMCVRSFRGKAFTRTLLWLFATLLCELWQLLQSSVEAQVLFQLFAVLMFTIRAR